MIKKIITFALVIAFGLGGLAFAGDAGNGKKLFNGKGKCKTCHKTSAKKKVGPGLKGIMSRVDEAWMKKWLHDPQGTWAANEGYTAELRKKLKKTKKKKTAMKIKKLSDSEIADIIAYLKTL